MGVGPVPAVTAATATPAAAAARYCCTVICWTGRLPVCSATTVVGEGAVLAGAVDAPAVEAIVAMAAAVEARAIAARTGTVGRFDFIWASCIKVLFLILGALYKRPGAGHGAEAALARFPGEEGRQMVGVRGVRSAESIGMQRPVVNGLS